MAVPDSSPRASTVVSVRNPQRLTLVDGIFFPPSCCAIPWGRTSAPAGVAPEALQERGCSCKVFFTAVGSLRGVSFSQHRQCFSRPRRCHAHVSTLVCVRCMSRRCSHASSPRAWAHSRRSGRALQLVCRPLRRPSTGRRGEVSATPIEQVANRGFLVDLIMRDLSGRLCPV
jgi:hypothetical protein